MSTLNSDDDGWTYVPISCAIDSQLDGLGKAGVALKFRHRPPIPGGPTGSEDPMESYSVVPRCGAQASSRFDREETSMEQTWLVTVGRLTLYIFYAFVGATLAGIAVGRVFRRPRSGLEAAVGKSSLLRLFVEYVGNSGLKGDGGAGEDRRRNWEARVLMEHIKEEMTRRAVPPSEREQLVEKLRASVRAEGQRHTG
jgi:hypothetical protein